MSQRRPSGIPSDSTNKSCHLLLHIDKVW